MKKVHLVYYDISRRDYRGVELTSKYKGIHNHILDRLNTMYPERVWIANKAMNKLFSKLTLTSPSFGSRHQFDLDLVSGYDMLHQDLYPYLEKSTLQELMLDLRLYREQYAISDNDMLVLLLSLKHEDVSDHESIILDNGDIILNTLKLDLDQMVQMIANNTTHNA